MTPSPHPFAPVQRVLRWPPLGKQVAHLLLAFPRGQDARLLVRHLLDHHHAEMFHPGERPAAEGAARELSIGFSHEGLRQIGVPAGYLAAMLANARAFAQGAPARAAQFLGDSGASDPAHWLRGFEPRRAHALLTVHARGWASVAQTVRELWQLADRQGILVHRLMFGQPLDGPAAGVQADGDWVHFGFRDNLSVVALRGFANPPGHPEHATGELLLGHPNDHGSNRWLLTALPAALRSFFRDGSFGVLRVIEQDVEAFERDVRRWAVQAQGDDPTATVTNWQDYVRAKLCGRWPDGHLFDVQDGDRPDRTRPIDGPFTHDADPAGIGCPMASHIRRMNPRLGPAASANARVAHARARPLLRRGTAYGDHGDAQRGLLGWFFCADIEAQFEHLLGQWGDRPPLGPDSGSDAKDPLIGQHEGAGGTFEIPRAQRAPLLLRGFAPYCRTRGTLYAFYPSCHALARMVEADGYDLFERDGDDPKDHDARARPPCDR